MKIAIIPARGGSKRIPFKNIKHFYGKPMIAWSIEAAKASKCFDRIFVSTDSQEIATLAKNYDAEVPFIRPVMLADDFTGTAAVIAHAIGWLIERGLLPSKVCSIYATAPFIKAEDIKRGLEVLSSTNALYALAVTSYPFPVQRAIRITQEQRLEMFQPRHLKTRSQDLEEAWHDAGQFCWGHTSAWLESIPVLSKNTVPIPLPRQRVQDIDTPEDWVQAELMMRVLRENESSGA